MWYFVELPIICACWRCNRAAGHATMTDHSRLEHMNVPLGSKFNLSICQKNQTNCTWPECTYLQLPLLQWGAGNVYLLVLSSWKVNIAENPIGVVNLCGHCQHAQCGCWFTVKHSKGVLQTSSHPQTQPHICLDYRARNRPKTKHRFY